MEFLNILEGLFTFIFIITMITQVIIPLWRNIPIFPLFNNSRNDLENGLKTLHELEDQHQLAEELRERTEKLLNSHKKV